MSISSVGSGGAAAFQQSYSVEVAKKALGATKESGARALELIQSAAAPSPALQPKPGHSLNVMA